MPTTANLGLTYPSLSNAPNVPQDIQTLAAGVDALFGSAYTGAYTPALTAASTNPTLGTGSTATGRYAVLPGRWCVVRGVIAFGTTGVAAGSGQYFVSLPLTASTSFTAGINNAGSAFLRDATGPDLRAAVCYQVSSTTISFITAATVVSNSAPWTWAASDYLSFSITYELA